VDQSGGVGEEVMESQLGTPEREMETTDQPRWEAALQILLPVYSQMPILTDMFYRLSKL
jgi:hypothetical protein